MTLLESRPPLGISSLLQPGNPLPLEDGSAQELVRYLRRNKFPLIAVSGRVEDSPVWQQAVAEEQAEYARQRQEYLLVKRAWADRGIDSICIKSGGFFPSFPYTSDNVDILVRAKDRDEAIRVLHELGYVWLRNIDEDHKLLFRKFHAGESVSAIHLHTWVGWDVEFLEDSIWDRRRAAEDDPELTVPSPEDLVLIHTAHALYENKRFTLYDLERIRANWRTPGFDWSYAEGIALRRGWLDGFLLALAVCACLEEALFGECSAEAGRRRGWEARLQHWPLVDAYLKRLIKRGIDAAPLSVSFAFSKLLYYRKILRDTHDRHRRRLSNVVHTLAWGIKQKSRLNPQPGMLVTFSGIDGSGKTSQIAALSRALSIADVTHEIVWRRIGCTPLYRGFSGLLRSLAIGKETRTAAAPGFGARSASPAPRVGFLRGAWAAANVIDIAAYYALRVRWPLLRGRVVLCDRYTPDAIAELRQRLPGEGRPELLARLLDALAPAPRLAFLLDLPACDAAPRADEGTEEDLARARRLYLDEARGRGATVVDAAAPFEEVSDQLVVQVLREYYRTYDTLSNGILLSNPSQLNRFDRELLREVKAL